MRKLSIEIDLSLLRILAARLAAHLRRDLSILKAVCSVVNPNKKQNCFNATSIAQASETSRIKFVTYFFFNISRKSLLISSTPITSSEHCKIDLDDVPLSCLLYCSIYQNTQSYSWSVLSSSVKHAAFGLPFRQREARPSLRDSLKLYWVSSTKLHASLLDLLCNIDLLALIFECDFPISFGNSEFFLHSDNNLWRW